MDTNEIKCIFLSEFHPVAGPKIVYQVPDDYISKDEFDTIHVYIITKPQLQDRIITINALGHKIVGCPMCIENAKYTRNALIFNVCFAFGANTNTMPYELAVKKLARYFNTLELESGFLSNEVSKQNIPGILARIKDELNQKKSCSIQIDGSTTTIHLKLISTCKDPPRVLGHNVPIMVADPGSLNSGHWDMCTQQLIPYIDGYKHVARIAAEADVDINIVKACLQNLVYHGAIKIISIFQYSNVYMTTPEINKLHTDPRMQTKCLTYVSKPGRIAKFRDVFLLYSNLTAGTTVRDLCARFNPHSIGIDERKLIQYGLIHGIIRRLEKYPIKLPSEPGKPKLRHLYRWFNGCHGYDEICCKTGFSFQELEERVESDPSIVVCWK